MYFMSSIRLRIFAFNSGHTRTHPNFRTIWLNRSMKKLILLPLLLVLCSTPVNARDYSKLFEKISPAVVTIHTVQTAIEQGQSGITQTKLEGLGSGVIIDKDGTILTASHVVHSANDVRVELKDGRRFKAKVISSIQSADLAIIRMLNPPDDIVYLEPGDSDKVSIGEEVFVIGAPYGLKHTLSTGNLSGRRVTEEIFFGDDLELLQTDAAINQGNSGGPLLSSRGELIGIVSHIQTQSGGNEGLGFAASINMAKNVILNRPPLWFGMQFVTLNSDALRLLNVKDYSLGFLVQHIAKNSLADNFGVRAGTFPI